jgi:hypothetical protein
MTRLVTLAAALALCFVPPLTAPLPAVIVASAVGLIVAALGIVTLWRWPITAAACVFLSDYAAALWVTDAAVGVVGAAGVGLALLVMVHSGELARGARRATLDARVVRSQAVRGAALAAATLGTALLVAVVSRVIAGTLPLVFAPLLAAAGALGVVLAIALLTSARDAGSRPAS